MKQRQIILYNVLFPLWILMLFPQTWLVVLPVNFIIDLLVLWLSLRYQAVPDRARILPRTIWKSWIAGFSADLLGAVPMLLTLVLGSFSEWFSQHISQPVMVNPFTDGVGFLWVAGSVALAGWAIYQLNLRWCLKNTPLTPDETKKTALAMAVCTAPYVFFFPSTLLYGF